MRHAGASAAVAPRAVPSAAPSKRTIQAMPELWVVNAGRLRYTEGVALQERVRARRQAGEIPDALLLVEHDPVYTKGRRSEPGHLPMGEDWYRMQGVEVEETDARGRPARGRARRDRP